MPKVLVCRKALSAAPCNTGKPCACRSHLDSPILSRELLKESQDIYCCVVVESRGRSIRKNKTLHLRKRYVVSKAVIFDIYLLLYRHPKKVDSVERQPINARH